MGHVARRTSRVLFTVALSLLTASVALAQSQVGLFIPATGQQVASLDRQTSNDPTRIRARVVTIDFPQLGTRDTKADRSTLLQLNLFEDASYQAVLDRIDPTPGGFVWVGHIQGVQMSNVTLAMDDGVMSGSVSLPDASYAIDLLALVSIRSSK